MTCGPVLANCLDEFENTEEQTEFRLHHQEGLANQIKIKQQVQSLIEVISTYGNPFEDDCPELLILNYEIVQTNQ